MVRYAQASKGFESYGIEGTAYTKASDTSTPFGLVRDDVDYPNPNPQTSMTTGGAGRGVYTHSPDPISREFDLSATVVNTDTPFELALGTRTESSEDPDATPASGDEYTKAVFTEADILPTATIEHVQDDLNFVEWFIGCKANLSISASSGEALTADFSFTATDHDFDDSGTATPSMTVPADLPDDDPFRFNMIGSISMSRSTNSSSVTTIATPNSIDFSWDNGNEVQHHGQGREGYAVAETTAEDKYDMSMNVNVENTDLYNEAAQDNALVDVEVVFDRDYQYPADVASVQDGVIIRLNECKVTSAPIPNPSEGVIETDISLVPTSTEIEVHTPV